MKQNNKEIEEYRINHPLDRTTKGNTGNNGAFMVPFRSMVLMVISNGYSGWDHVSVSLSNRCPNWKEMCFIKDLFFEEYETVVQFHPKKSEYENYHPYCLHLWRNQTKEFELPGK